MQTHRGMTILELLIALALIGILVSVAAPSLRTTVDVLSARAAREAAFGLLSRARALALQYGGAEIELDAVGDRIVVRRPSGVIEADQAFAPRGVDLQLDSTTTSVVLRYDAYGLGRMMSRTVTFTARSAQAGLTISSFGRARRW